MSDINLGFEPPKDAQRDAIHIAVIPVVAGQQVEPGTPVAFIDGLAYPTDYSYAVGIVDPFRTDYIGKGYRFWLFLKPNTVIGMRHHWSHQMFEDASNSPKTQKNNFTKEESKAWLENFIKTHDCPELDDLVERGEIRHYDSDCYLHFDGLDAHGSIPLEFWVHFENYTGKEIPYKPTSFSCSC